MWLRLTTTALMIFGLMMLFMSGLIVGERPPTNSPRAAKITYLRRSALYVGLESVALIGSIVGAWLIVRRARHDFREQSKENFQSLLEGTLRDHKKPEEES